MRSHWLRFGRLERVLRTASTVFEHPSASAISEKFSSALARVLTSTQNTPQNLVQFSKPGDKCILSSTSCLPVSNLICHIKAYLALSLATQAGNDESSLFICRLLGRDDSDNLGDNFTPASEVRVCRTIHKPMLVSCTAERKFSQWTQINQNLLELRKADSCSIL